MAVTEVKMPQISMTMLEGVVVKWLKKEGDPVTEGEPLLEIETDKIVTEINAPASGFVTKILALESERVLVGKPICLIGDTCERPQLEPAPQISEDKKQGINKLRISPAARHLARELGIEISGGIKGTGPGGLIVKADIEKAGSRKAARAVSVPPAKEPVTLQDVEVIPLTGIRKRIAEHMTISKQNAADVTTVAEVDMTQVAALRNYLPASYTVFTVKATALALREFPLINSSLMGEEIHLKKRINICVAVATDTGLITPVIRDVDKKNILTITEEMDDLARRGREGTLTPDDFSEGTFTVTNSGVFGSLFFTPVINYPQSAILGMGKVLKTPVVRENEIVIAPMMYLCLTYDHRVIDGQPAVQFLQKIKHYLENPRQLVQPETYRRKE